MTILDSLKAQSLQARKDRAEHSSLLITVIAAIQRIGKDTNTEPTDSISIKVIKDFLQNAKDTKKLVMDAGGDCFLQDMEISVLEKLIPQQLSADKVSEEIRAVLKNIPAPYSMKNMGAIKSHFEKNFSGLYDGAVVKQLFESILKE